MKLELDKEKKLMCGFIAAVMLLCIMPLVCMSFARTDETTEKKELAAMPSLVSDGELNTEYLSQLGAYFTDHFAFRQQLVSIDSTLRAKLFGVSADESVVVGRDGWLFYSDTLSDYTGSDPMSEREIFNIANNLALTQQFVSQNGAEFAFTIAPNKNTLYPQFMPYYTTAAKAESHNAIRLEEMLTARGINYVNLFELFEEQEEILYYARDSHWNNTGALLVCEELLRSVSDSDVSFMSLEGETGGEYVGDLNLMLFPDNPAPEEDITYAAGEYSFINGAQSVEDPIIVASASDVPGSLLMYRDSFGNSMIPFMAGAYAKSCFVRTVPYNLETYMMIHQPTTVIIEKVERSIDELAALPPVFQTSDTQLLVSGAQESDSWFEVCEPEENIMFWRIDGEVDEELVDPRSRIFVRITDADGVSTTREAFTVTLDNSDFGLTAYISKEAVGTDVVTVEIIAAVKGAWTVLSSGETDLGSIASAF